MNADATDETKRSHHVKGGPQGGTEPDHFNDHVGATAACHLVYPGQHALPVFGKVQRLGTQAPGQLEAAVDAVDRKEVLGLMLQRRDHRTQADGPASYHDSCGLGGLLRAKGGEGVLGAEEARREDVGHQDERVIADAAGRLEHSPVGEGHAHVVCLRTIQAR
jgi:hypothetical protein